jgi:hypothetical protein
MSFLHSMVSFQMGWLIGAAIVLGVLLVLWLSALVNRKWFVTIKRSEETELMTFHMRRIADAIERLATERESQTQPSLQTSPSKPIGMSTFGR